MDWHERFTYHDGELYWKKINSLARGIKIGDRAGYTQAGDNQRPPYRAVRVDGKQYYIHRIIYEMFYETTELQIDHIDNNSLNNRIENLRSATISDNVRNIKTPKHNTSGIKGVCWHKKNQKWNAQIGVNGKRKSLGYFDKIEDAAKAYEEAAKMIYGEFSNIEGAKVL